MCFGESRDAVNTVSLTDIANQNKLIVDISKISLWKDSDKCYLKLDIFRSGTMQVEKRRFWKQYAQIKHFRRQHH